MDEDFAIFGLKINFRGIVFIAKDTNSHIAPVGQPGRHPGHSNQVVRAIFRYSH